MRLLFTSILLFTTQGVDASPLGDKARELGVVLDVLDSQLSSDVKQRVDELLDEARGLAQNGQSGDEYRCLSNSGFGYLVRAGSTSMIGDYYSSVAECRRAVAGSRFGLICQGRSYQRILSINAERYPANYYQDLDECLQVLAYADNQYLCERGSLNSSFWYVYNWNTERRVQYLYRSKEECFENL